MTDFFRIFCLSVEMLGTVAFAASGAILAIDREMDLFGVIFLGSITAVGGGILRDVLLGTFPPSAFSNPIYVTVALVTSAVVFLLARVLGRHYWSNLARVDRLVNLLDAAGLGIFSVVGAQISIGKGFGDNAFLCIVMGMTSGVVGGILRDVLAGTTPAVLRKRIYAVASLAGAALYYGLISLGLDGGAVSMLPGMGLTLLIRILATCFMWDLPTIPHPPEE